MTLPGIDYSYARPGGAAIAAAGKRFVVRYLPPGDGRSLTQMELADLLGHGIEVALVWESGKTRALGGESAGLADGAAAKKATATLGISANVPVYFAVDYDAPATDFPTIDAYLGGAAQGLGGGLVGVYAGLRVIRHCQAVRSASWFWQTYAWSGTPTVWASGTHLQQYLNGQTLNGGAVDLDRAMVADFGQWPRPLPDSSTGAEMQLDPSILTSYVADFSPGATVYRDAARTIVFKSVWEGGSTVGVVGVDAKNYNACINLYETVNGVVQRALVYVGTDHMTNYRPRVAPPAPADTTPFAQADIDAAVAAQASADQAAEAAAVASATSSGFNAGRQAVLDAGAAVPKR